MIQKKKLNKRKQERYEYDCCCCFGAMRESHTLQELQALQALMMVESLKGFHQIDRGRNIKTFQFLNRELIFEFYRVKLVTERKRKM